MKTYHDEPQDGIYHPNFLLVYTKAFLLLFKLIKRFSITSNVMSHRSKISDNVELANLWSGVRQGDKQAFSALFLRNYTHLYNYGRKLYNESDIVEDAIQDVFATIWQTKERLSMVSSVKAYLIISLRRQLLRLLQKKRMEDPVGDGIKDIVPNIEFSVEEVVLNSAHDALHTSLVEVLNQLPNQKKEVIYLYFYSGMDYEEIAQIMDLNIQTVRNYMSMALSRAKDIIIENELPKFLLTLAIFTMILPH